MFAVYFVSITYFLFTSAERAIVDQKAFLALEMHGIVEAMRVETVAVHREQLDAVHRKSEKRLVELSAAIESNASTCIQIKRSLTVRSMY
jgi:DNA-binding transcriptional regulator YhcF (GntR family)